MDLYFIPDLIHDFFVDFNFITLFIFLFIIIFYLVVCFVIFDMYKSLYGKKNYLCWIPVVNIYVLGDLLFGKAVGYSLCGCFILISLLNTFIEASLFISLLSMIYFICLIIVFGFSIYRYIYLKKNKINDSMSNNTLNLGNESISSVKTNGPTESMINNINIIPTNNIGNINSVPIQNTIFSNTNTNNENVEENTNLNKLNNIGLFNVNSGNNSNVNQIQSNNSITNSSEKHYEMPKLILEASQNSSKKEDSNKKFDDKNDKKVDESLEEEKMKFITGVEDDDKMKFVTGENNINSAYSSGNMVPKEEEITVVNGVISSPDDLKNVEEKKMNIVNGTIVPNQNNNNNQNINYDSILDLNKKL